MERIINYSELPSARGQSVYLRMETDPELYINLLLKGYRIIKDIKDADETTIYVTGRRQDTTCTTAQEYEDSVNSTIQNLLQTRGIRKPKTIPFSFEDLVDHKYKLPFVLKNEKQNGGREKFLIETEEDYDNLIKACIFLININLLDVNKPLDEKFNINYGLYLDECFVIQEYIETPSEYNTTVRLLTTPTNDLMYASLKYNTSEDYLDRTTLLGYLLHEVFPLSTKSIVSNTLSGGENILIGEANYPRFEKSLLRSHNISSGQFEDLVDASEYVHETCNSELGIICGFDYIYDVNQEEWFMLECHSRPMVGDYSKRQGISYDTKADHLTADGRVRATALSLSLKKTR